MPGDAVEKVVKVLERSTTQPLSELFAEMRPGFAAALDRRCTGRAARRPPGSRSRFQYPGIAER